MSGWIKFWKDMPNDPRVLTAATKLSEKYLLARRTKGGGSDLSSTETCNAWRNAVTGALATLWCYADEHIHDDDTLPLTSQTLDAVVGLEGFFEVMPREWIDELDDGSVILPGYCEKNSLIAKRKRTIKSNARVTRWRRAKKANSNGVTHQHETQCNAAGDSDKDSDKDNKKKSKNPDRAAAQPRDEPSEFVDIRKTFPKRAGSHRWHDALSAYRARVSEGCLPSAIAAGVLRYAAFIRASGKEGTEYVQQAATFLGKNRSFELPWHPPAKPETAHDRMNRLLNGDTDDSRVIEHDAEFPALTGH